MQDVNVRGTFMLTKAALPHLLASPDPKVLTLSPPINLDPRWFAGHPAYTMAKYGMTLAALGFAHELGQKGVSSTCLWPATLVATDAIGNLPGGDQMLKVSRKPDIVADAAWEVLTTEGQGLNGQTRDRRGPAARARRRRLRGLLDDRQGRGPRARPVPELSRRRARRGMPARSRLRAR